MQLSKLLADDDAVSPVIGVILMVAITVILAAVIGTFVLGLGGQVSNSAPSANLGFTESGSGGSISVTLVHNGGDPVDTGNLKAKGASCASDPSAGTMTAGDTASVSDGSCSHGDEINIVWTSPSSGDTSIIASHTVQSS